MLCNAILRQTWICGWWKNYLDLTYNWSLEPNKSLPKGFGLPDFNIVVFDKMYLNYKNLYKMSLYNEIGIFVEKLLKLYILLIFRARGVPMAPTECKILIVETVSQNRCKHH